MSASPVSLLSILIPVFNEERLVAELLGRVAEVVLPMGMPRELVIVDDGSSDRTREVVSQWIEAHPAVEAKLVIHDRNLGKGAAVRTGIDSSKGDVLVIQDADLEYDPNDIVEVIQPILEGSCHVVYGSRILMEKALGRSGICGLITGKHPHSYVMAYLGGVMITKWVNFLTDSHLTDEPTCYKCFTRHALCGVEIRNDDFAWEPEITMKLLKAGYRIREVPISYHPRKREEGKKIHWQDGVKALWTVWKNR
jgi:glycosyltransferase involved in cell wall biosynthesis